MKLVRRIVACVASVTVSVAGVESTAGAQVLDQSAIQALTSGSSVIGVSSSGSSDPGLTFSGSTGTGSLGASAAGLPFRRAALPSTGAKVVAQIDWNGDPQVKQLWVDSPAFGRVIRVGLLLPADRSTRRPTLEMFDGFKAWQSSDTLDGGSDWLLNGGAKDFFRDKKVNVVLAVDGGPSYYRDWAAPLPGRGSVAFDTFFAKEIPEIIDSQFEGNGVWGIAGLSMGAQATYMQAVRHPELYSTVAGFSGCYDTSNDFGRAQIGQTLQTLGMQASQIFGPASDPRWQENDPWLHMDALRGKTLWLSASSGKPGVSDWNTVMSSPKTSAEGSFKGLGDSIPGLGEILSDTPMLDPILAGGPYEAIALNCSRRFEQALAAVGIPSTTDYNPTGVHDWENWRAELPKAWSTLARGLGVVA